MTHDGIRALPLYLAISKLIDKKIALQSSNHLAAMERIEQDIQWLEERIADGLSRVNDAAG